jgi:hypothetical protein
MKIKEFYKLKKEDVVIHRVFGECEVVEVKRLNNGIALKCKNKEGINILNESTLKGLGSNLGWVNCFIEMKASFVNKKKEIVTHA